MQRAVQPNKPIQPVPLLGPQDRRFFEECFPDLLERLSQGRG
jgi:hypothetical protein